MIPKNGVVLNARSLRRPISGVERYTMELSRCMGDSLRREELEHPIPAPAGHFWEQFILPFRVKRSELLWSPANTGPLAVCNQVLTLHDTSVLEHPEWYQPAFARWYRFLLPRLARRVRHILTDSEYSRRRILEVLSLPPGKVSTVSAGVNLSQFRPASEAEIADFRRRYSLPDTYLLFLGTLEPRKNLSMLVKVWEQVCPQYPGLDLVLAGNTSANFAPIQPFPRHARIRQIGFVDESDLPALYSGAELFLLPSLSEGFGLPVLEAMACGTPVIASRAGALPEVAGGAAILLDPLNIADWILGISTLLADPGCRQAYRQHGLEHVRRFAWERHAAEIRNVLERLLHEQ